MVVRHWNNRLERIEKEAYTMPKHKHWTQTPEGRQRLSEIQARIRERKLNKTLDEHSAGIAAEPTQTQNPRQMLYDAIQAYWNRCTLAEQLRAVALLHNSED